MTVIMELTPTVVSIVIINGDHMVTVTTQIDLPFAVSCLAAIRLHHAVAGNTNNFLYLYFKVLSTLNKNRD
jgi:hypothetical protein